MTANCKEPIKTARTTREEQLMRSLRTKLTRKDYETLATTIELLHHLIGF